MYEIFERLLKEKGLRRADVSRATGIAQSTLSDWKHGRTKDMSIESLKLIADYLDVSVDYLMTGEEQPAYYIDEEVAQIAQELHDDPNMRGLFKAARNLSKEDILKFKEIIEGYERGYNGEDD